MPGEGIVFMMHNYRDCLQSKAHAWRHPAFDGRTHRPCMGTKRLRPAEQGTNRRPVFRFNRF